LTWPSAYGILNAKWDRCKPKEALVRKSIANIPIRMVAAALLIGFCLSAGMVVAQSYDPDQSIPKPTKLEKRLTQLGRGLSNILFGWAEIPLTFDRKLKEGKPLTYLLGVVPVLGTGRAVMRTGTGFYEVFTFRSTKPEVNYEAMLEPEYIF
jgi:putative exosortase-associated protein (TIGR04073 family)